MSTGLFATGAQRCLKSTPGATAIGAATVDEADPRGQDRGRE